MLVCHKATGRHKFQSTSRPYMCSRGLLLPHCTGPSLDARSLCRSSRVTRAPSPLTPSYLGWLLSAAIVVTHKGQDACTVVSTFLRCHTILGPSCERALSPLTWFYFPGCFAPDCRDSSVLESLFPLKGLCSSSFKRRLRALCRRSLFRLACPCTVRHEGGVKIIAVIPAIFPFFYIP